MPAPKKAAKKPAQSARRESTAPAEDQRLTRLEALIGLLERSSLAEMSYEDKDIAVTLRRGVSAPNGAPPIAPPSPVPAHTAAPAATEPADPNVRVLTSPFVGTFYRSPKPEMPPFVSVGDRVQRGQTVCIIEAMKLMNELECEVEGTVEAILVENGSPVQYGDELFRIRVR